MDPFLIARSPLVSSSSLQEIVCLLGQPVAGDPTQFMMERAFERAGLDWRFLTFEVHPDRLAAALNGADALGFYGALLIAPHHRAATALVKPLSTAAEVSGTVNLLRRREAALHGDNTLGAGALAAVRSVIDPAGKRVVLLGAGGAASSIAAELISSGIAALTIVNRTLDRAEQLADRLRSALANSATPVPIDVVEWKGEHVLAADTEIVIHATSLNQTDLAARVPLKWPTSAGLVVVDLSYNPVEPRILREAKERHFVRVAGLSVFIEQSALTFAALTGLPADRALLQDAVEEFFG